MDVLSMYGCQNVLQTVGQVTSNTFVYLLDEIRGRILPYPSTFPTPDICPSPSQSDLDLSKTQSMVDGLSQVLSHPEQTTYTAVHEQCVTMDDETRQTPCHRHIRRKRAIIATVEELKQHRHVCVIPKRRKHRVEQSLRDQMLRSKAHLIYRRLVWR